jgi:hypothetical protein
MDSIIKRNEVVIMDWDGVIQFIDKAWLAGVKVLEEEFKPYFNMDKLRFGEKGFVNDIVHRKEYYLNEWLMKDKKQELPKEVFETFMQIYTQDVLFYERCTFLGAAQTAISLSMQDFCQEIIFLSHVPYVDGIDPRKEILFKRYFGSYSDKFKLQTIHSSKPKWEWIAENRPDYTCVFDDRFDILLDIIKNTDSEKKTFMMPYLGYNKYFETDKELLLLFEKKGIVFSTYKQSFLTNWH